MKCPKNPLDNMSENLLLLRIFLIEDEVCPECLGTIDVDYQCLNCGYNAELDLAYECNTPVD